jgi:uncharacterized membrane protein YecN with MAPEG domain
MPDLSNAAFLAAALYVGLNLILLVLLGLNVSLNRRGKQISVGDGGDDKVTGAVRAHGNQAEWAPLFMVGLVVAALMGIPAYAIHAVGGTFTAGRVLHAFGMLSTTGVSFGRFAGSLLTLLAGLLLGAGLVVHSLT